MLYVLFWAVLYGAVHIFFSRFFGNILPFAMLAYTAFLLAWLYRKGKWKSLGLCKISPLSQKTVAVLMPVLLPSAVNILLQKGINIDFAACLTMISAVTVEEIFFRGVLLCRTEGLRTFAVISANGGIFAIFHLVNVISHGNSVYVFMQILFAFALGVLYASVRLRFKSIIPCIIAHFFSNITAFGLAEQGSVWIWVSAAFCLCWGFILCRNAGMYQKEQ